MVEVYGMKMKGKLLPLPKVMQTESVPGQRYQIEISTEGVSNAQQVIDLLRTELPRQLKGLKVKYIQVAGNVITLQIVGSPFNWPLFMAILPNIIGGIGVVVTIIAIYLLFSMVPPWIAGLLVVGTTLLFIGPQIGKIITPAHLVAPELVRKR